MVGMLVLGVLFGLFAIRLERARKQAAAVATIRSHGGEVYYDYEISPDIKPGIAPVSAVPESLLRALGVDFFHDVGQVSLGPAALPTPQGNINRCWSMIGNLAQVEKIVAYRDWITPAAIEIVSHHPELRQLVLRQRDLTGFDLAPLARLKNLESLDLNETNVGDEEAVHFSNFPKLEILSLNKTRVGNEGAARIAANRSLKYLYLDGTLVGDRGAAEIAELKSLRRLVLSRTQLTDAGLAQLAKLPELSWLEMRFAPVTGTGFTSFPAGSRLTRIGMHDCPVNDEGMLAIGRFGQLEDLFLGGSETTSVSMASLGQISWPNSIERVHLRGLGLTDEGLMRFVGCPKLSQIVITRTKVTPSGVKRFRSARPTVHVVGP